MDIGVKVASNLAEEEDRGAKNAGIDARNILRLKKFELSECLKPWFRIGILIGNNLCVFLATIEEEESERELDY